MDLRCFVRIQIMRADGTVIIQKTGHASEKLEWSPWDPLEGIVLQVDPVKELIGFTYNPRVVTRQRPKPALVPGSD